MVLLFCFGAKITLCKLGQRFKALKYQVGGERKKEEEERGGRK